MSHLSEIQKAILMLHLDGFSNAEISDVIGITQTNVSTKLSRIKQKLINEYQKEQKNAN